MILGVRRIIPARAGFTYSLSSCVRRIADHPRSRGVYRTARTRSPSGRGSSPLARGLQPPARGFGAAPGIIPARAGFTRRRLQRPRQGQDHPRSRGVYVIKAFADAGWLGSSPLARGLRPTAALVAPAGGIIPARAGFTVEHERDHRRGGDHPRSRGGYAPACSAAALAAGGTAGGQCPPTRGGGYLTLGGLGALLPPIFDSLPFSSRLMFSRCRQTSSAAMNRMTSARASMP